MVSSLLHAYFPLNFTPALRESLAQRHLGLKHLQRQVHLVELQELSDDLRAQEPVFIGHHLHSDGVGQL